MFQSLAGQYMVPPMPCVMFQNQVSPCHLMSCPQTLSLSISLASRLLKIGLKSLKARSSHNTFLFFSLLEFHSWRWKIISNIFYKRVRAKIRLGLGLRDFPLPILPIFRWLPERDLQALGECFLSWLAVYPILFRTSLEQDECDPICLIKWR